MLKRKVAALAALGAFGFGLATGVFVHADFFPKLSTYGYSIGTNNAYCSVDLVQWRPELTCQHSS
jgi:hypothetical protein